MYKHNNYSRYARRRYFKPKRRIRSFDPRTVIGKATSSYQDVYEIKNDFADFPLDSRLAKNIVYHKYNAPTAIQDQAIPVIISGRDVVGVANTGTGKTAAFLIPLINKVVPNRNSRVLIIAPTRELAVQINKELQSLT